MLSFSENIALQPISSIYNFHTTADVLRLDQLHPQISGNKWFKLKNYLEDAAVRQKSVILSFGGAFSNHILATAAAAKRAGFKSIGIIRGERPPMLSPTLDEATSLGMQLFFISREAYRNKEIPQRVYEVFSEADIYVISEGGFGTKGKQGAGEILNIADTTGYTHILSAVGTGTTLAGLAAAARKEQQVVGISVLKNHFSLEDEINTLLTPAEADKVCLIHDYHFGGYAKFNSLLISFMNSFYRATAIPTDFVYTAKLFFAANELIERRYFPVNARLLIIHSGGLQGNRSLSKGTLIF
jgi:1-aminocyclopropane-1-carboxylate deaminase